MQTQPQAKQDTVVKVGNVGRDPELRFTPAGKAVCNFSLAVATPKYNDENGRPDWKGEKSTTWYEIAVWDQMAENVAQSIGKGDRVFVQGRPEVEEYENDSKTMTRKKITADVCGPDLRWSTCTVVRPERKQPEQTRAYPVPVDDEPF